MEHHDGARWNPAFLGPLDDQFAPVTGAVRCFAGEQRFLSERKLEARERLWHVVSPLLSRVLDDDETVLHVAPVVHNPRFLEVFGFGMWYVLFFRAALVVTDRRVVEIMLRTRASADTCVRSYSWGQVRQLKMGFGGLVLKPAKGRTQRWRIQERGDRRLLKLLLPKIVEQVLPRDIHTPRPVPLWHCPGCGASFLEHPVMCTQCATRFKSRGLAAALALAFPGAGLLYAGHPVLAVLDFLGESMIFVVVAALFLLAGGPAEVVGALVFGAVAFGFTKLESAHMATVLVRRMRPDVRPSRWRRAAIGGAVLTLLLMVVPPALNGAFANRLDRDLDLAANRLGWRGGHDPASWRFGADLNQRSEWIRDDGQGLFVFSFPLGMDESFESLAWAFAAEYGEDGVHEVVVGGFDGLRVVDPQVDEDGVVFLWTRWVLFDREYDDVHVLGTPVFDGNVDDVEAVVDGLVREARWMPADG
jgi:hypothetical protein